MDKLCIGLGSGLGAGNTGCKDAPLFLQKHLLLPQMEWKSIISNENLRLDKYEVISELNTRYAEESFKLASSDSFFFAFGGDHSSAIGMWSGVSIAKKEEGDIGLIWIDAHMDSHTSETSESGNIHGMPLASLLGYGDLRLKNILSGHPKIKPENLVLIGIRSFEPAEKEFLERLNVKVYYIDEVLEKGLSSILTEVIADLSKRTVGYGVSFDVDSMDPSVVQATGTMVPNGIQEKEALEAMEILVKNPPLAFELVEYNPNMDVNKETLSFIKKLLFPLMKIKNHKTIELLNR